MQASQTINLLRVKSNQEIGSGGAARSTERASPLPWERADASSVEEGSPRAALFALGAAPRERRSLQLGSPVLLLWKTRAYARCRCCPRCCEL